MSAYTVIYCHGRDCKQQTCATGKQAHTFAKREVASGYPNTSWARVERDGTLTSAYRNVQGKAERVKR